MSKKWKMRVRSLTSYRARQRRLIAMLNRLPLPRANATAIVLTLLFYVLLLTLASCATPPQVVSAPCPAFPARPLLALPATGQFHKALTSILATDSTQKLLTPAITP